MLRAVFYGASALVLLWDVVTAGTIARLPRTPRTFAYLSAFCGLLVLPAVIVVASAGSVLTGRATHAIDWLWPLTCTLFALQASYALVRRMATPALALPITAYNWLIAAAAVSRALASFDDVLLPAVLIPEAARANALGLVFGRAALGDALAVLVPVLVPATPARGRSMRAARSTLAAASALAAVIIAIEWPAAARAVSTYAPFDGARLQERPAGDLALGLWILPALDRPPPPLALTYDLRLADSLAPAALAVEVTPEGARGPVLDSLARALDRWRRDSTLLIVALGYDRGDRTAWRTAPDSYLVARVQALERIVRSLRPDIVLPAREPYEAGTRALGRVPVSWWMRYLRMAADTVHHLRPRTRVGLAASSFSPADSALYHWAAARGSGVDLLGFVFTPSYAGGLALQARLRTADRWLRRTGRVHWVFSAGETPATHGERNQARALWGTVTWASTRPNVRGVLVRSAGDYDAVNGLRAPGGRLRPVVDVFRQASTLLAESRTSGRQP